MTATTFSYSLVLAGGAALLLLLPDMSHAGGNKVREVKQQPTDLMKREIIDVCGESS